LICYIYFAIAATKNGARHQKVMNFRDSYETVLDSFPITTFAILFVHERNYDGY